MAKTKQTAKRKQSSQMNSDGVYLLKLVLYVILGTQWLWIVPSEGTSYPVPIGLLLGMIFAAHEHFRVDRKIEYAILLAAMLVGFVAKIGIFVTL